MRQNVRQRLARVNERSMCAWAVGGGGRRWEVENSGGSGRPRCGSEKQRSQRLMRCARQSGGLTSWTSFAHLALLAPRPASIFHNRNPANPKGSRN